MPGSGACRRRENLRRDYDRRCAAEDPAVSALLVSETGWEEPLDYGDDADHESGEHYPGSGADLLYGPGSGG